MQIYQNTTILYSPTDLVTFLSCRHASYLDRKALTETLIKAEESKSNQLLQKKGLEHEAAYLEALRDEGRTIAEIPKGFDLQKRAALTLDAMKSGVDVVYQGVFFAAPWRGDADFLLKCDKPSQLGNYSYEVLDTKLARTVEPKHIIQLCVYSELLEALQGVRPERIFVHLGTQETCGFRLDEFFHYYKRARERFELFMQAPPHESIAEPCSYCVFCHWSDLCKQQWEADDHLNRIANIKRAQIARLEAAGIRTLTALANASTSTKIPGLNPAIFHRLQAQAALQHFKINTGVDKYELLPAAPGKGLARIPAPNEGDLFFDMEGDPLYPGGLEYLFGVYYQDNGQKRFLPFWGHDPEGEKEAFRQFMGFVSEHLTRYPQAHIYHYNHYETTALKRLACRYASCEDVLDALLQRHVFVDLYVVVREAVRTSEPGYSIKNLETFYMEKRANDVANAAESIIAYHEWRETGSSKILQEIADYNEVDCRSTKLLRDWLLALPGEGNAHFSDEEQVESEDVEEHIYAKEDIEHALYREKLCAGIDDEDGIRERLSDLLEFHRREEKPQWWGHFELQNRTEDDLLEDASCLAGLVQNGEPEPEKRSMIYSYRFPPQQYKMRVRDKPVDTETLKEVGTIVELDEVERIVRIKRGVQQEPLSHHLSLGPPKPLTAPLIRSGIYRYADHVMASPEAPHAATELLARNIPRIRGKRPGEALVTSGDVQADALKAVEGLEDSYLFIQGPPGAGKTYTSSRIIVELIRQGKKIGITSNSHKAIHNLLAKVEAVAQAADVPFRGIKKASGQSGESVYKSDFTSSVTKTDQMDPEANLFAGTAWTFAHPHFDGLLDYLFIDEAGQVATANVVGMGGATRNLVLVGDQMQLGQPVQGVHPGEAGLSVLEFLLGDQATIAPDRGIFLAQTRRMRPSICQFISEAFYDGRLTAHDSTLQRYLTLQGTDLPNEGIVVLPVQHKGCSQKSEEEGAILKARFEQLLGQQFTDNDGVVWSITAEDILVVTPYNVQVNYLRSILPEDANIGTVDKFQGQEAPIVLISMVTSSAEELPRNIEFLYSRNRLNVAISRAQCLAVVIANPALLDISCRTVEQMVLVNTVCWLDDYAMKLTEISQNSR